MSYYTPPQERLVLPELDDPIWIDNDTIQLFGNLELFPLYLHNWFTVAGDTVTTTASPLPVSSVSDLALELHQAWWEDSSFSTYFDSQPQMQFNIANMLSAPSSRREAPPLPDAVASSAGRLGHQSRVFLGHVKCTFPKCERFAFVDQADLGCVIHSLSPTPPLILSFSSHIDTHHKCNVLGCKQIELFSAKGQLDRHKRSVHGIGPTKHYYCTQPGCNRGANGRGFPRRDHLLQHVRSHREERCNQKRARFSSDDHSISNALSEELFSTSKEDPSCRDKVACDLQSRDNGYSGGDEGDHLLKAIATKGLPETGINSLVVPLGRKRLRPSSPSRPTENISAGDISKNRIVGTDVILLENQELKAKVAELEGRVAGLEYALAQIVKK
jgi:hypothetical protein